MSAYLRSVLRVLRFWSRLPLPPLPFEDDPYAPPVMAELAPAAPVAGALLGAVAAAALLLGLWLGLGPWPSAIAATAALVLATGAMHEDALADVADGFGAGGIVERKLEIMRDPRLGSFGVAALALALLMRAALVVEFVVRLGPWRAAAALVGAAALARIAGLWPLVALPAVRRDGAGAAAGLLPRRAWFAGIVVGAAIAGGLAVPAGVALATLAAIAGALAAAWGVARLALRQIGGQTGDVCGAAVMLAEIAFLAVLLASASALAHS